MRSSLNKYFAKPGGKLRWKLTLESYGGNLRWKLTLWKLTLSKLTVETHGENVRWKLTVKTYVWNLRCGNLRWKTRVVKAKGGAKHWQRFPDWSDELGVREQRFFQVCVESMVARDAHWRISNWRLEKSNVHPRRVAAAQRAVHWLQEFNIQRIAHAFDDAVESRTRAFVFLQENDALSEDCRRYVIFAYIR